MKINRIVGVIPLYQPKKQDFPNILKYINDLDYCFLLDDTGKDNSFLCKEIVDVNPDKIQYVCNTENIGLCASVNNGFKLAKEKNADWVLIMNPDGTFQNDAIKIYRRYIDTQDTSDTAIVSPIFNLDRRKREASTGTKIVWHPDMSGCLYNMKVLDELGYYDQNTYFYGLDEEYCIRVRKNGYKIIQCSEAVLNHHPAETYCVKFLGKTVLKCGKDNPQRYYYQFRSGYYIHKKYHDLHNFMFCVYKFTKVVLFFDHKEEYFKMIRLGIMDAKNRFYGNIKERNES